MRRDKVNKLQRAAAAALVVSLLHLSTGSVFADTQLINPPVASATDALTIRKAFRLESDPLVSIIQRDAKVEDVLRGLAQKANLSLIFMGDGSTLTAPVSAAPASTSSSAEEDPLAALTKEADSASSGSSTSASSSAGMVTNRTIPYLELKNVPVSEAFALVLQMSGLVGRRIYNSLLITTPDTMTKMGFSSPVIKTYRIYNQASTAAVSSGNTTTSAGGGGSSPLIDQLKAVFTSRNMMPAPQMMLDTRTSTLILVGTQEAIDIADQLIPVLDQPLPQVVVEVKLIELTKAASEQLGVSYGFGQGKVGVGFNNPALINGQGNPVTGTGETGITFSSLSNFAPNFNVRLNALIQNRQARVLTSPRLTIQHGVQATFDSTTQFPISSTTATATAVTQTITSLDIGEKLAITPFIDLEKNLVTMKLKPEISTRGAIVQVGAQTIPEKNLRTVETILAVPDGQSVIIGGLMRKNDSEIVSKIPVLGDIPILGALFSTTQKQTEDVEVVIMVTPHILETH